MPEPPADDADELDSESASDFFCELPWWTLGRAGAAAKCSPETSASSGGNADAETISADGDDNYDIATILRRALMDLAAALQEIERQLTSVPEDGVAPTRG